MVHDMFRTRPCVQNLSYELMNPFAEFCVSHALSYITPKENPLSPPVLYPVTLSLLYLCKVFSFHEVCQ